MATAYSHETLSDKIDEVFTTVVSEFIPGETTTKMIERTVMTYMVENFELDPIDSFYVKSIIGAISYLDVSNILDDLTSNDFVILEKCCKYDDTNKIFLIVLIKEEASQKEE